MSLLSAKQTLRKQMLAKRHSFSALEGAQQSLLIQDHVLSLPVWQQAKRIACYLALPGEVSCHQLIESAWNNNQQICAPVIDQHSHNMTFSDFNDFSALQPGPFGLLQPVNEPLVAGNKIDIMIIPGLAFDRQGHRIGFGKGYYDHYLNGYTGHRLALVHDYQLVDNVPINNHDQAVHLIITKNKVISAEVN